MSVIQHWFNEYFLVYYLSGSVLPELRCIKSIMVYIQRRMD